MTQAQHTPGPWFVGAQNDTRYIIDRRPNANGNDAPNHDADTGVIAKVYDTGRNDDYVGEANAHLIAAAPELLNIAERLDAFWTECGFKQDEHSPIWADIKAAIAKAKGGAQ